MTKSQNTKNEQQKDLCITSEQLTEQWKKGKLSEGWYWVEGSRAEGIYAYTAEYLNNMYRPRNGEKIIEQVPSYEKFDNIIKCYLCAHEKANRFEKENQKLKENIHSMLFTDDVIQNRYDKAIQENAQLKELLEECSPYIGHSATSRMIKNSAGYKKDMKLLTKIDEALR